MWSYYYQSMRFFDTLNFHQWLYLGMGVFVLGMIMMRGFGSRAGY